MHVRSVTALLDKRVSSSISWNGYRIVEHYRHRRYWSQGEKLRRIASVRLAAIARRS